VVPGPLGVQNKIFRDPKCDLRVKVCAFLDVRIDIYKKIANAIAQKTSSLIILANITNLRI